MVRACQICRDYTNAAIKSVNENIKLQCGLTGERWGKTGHFDWCYQHYREYQTDSSVSNPAPAETAARERAIEECKLANAGGLQTRKLGTGKGGSGRSGTSAAVPPKASPAKKMPKIGGAPATGSGRSAMDRLSGDGIVPSGAGSKIPRSSSSRPRTPAAAGAAAAPKPSSTTGSGTIDFGAGGAKPRPGPSDQLR
jgi:hypothetical protein